MSIAELLSLVKFGLENFDTGRGFARTVRVVDLRVMNVDALLCEFRPHSSNSIDVKGEVYSIMRFFNGFFKDDPFVGVRFVRYAVRAVDEDGEEIMYAISSAAAVRHSDPIEWMKSTLFQDMTPDFRLAQAKRMIAEIETLLRRMIVDGLGSQFGIHWWDAALNNRLGAKIKKQYREQYGVVVSDGTILIQHTYLNNVADIILTHWVIFRSMLPSRQRFETIMPELNDVRRDEAHNRQITSQQIKRLEQIYFELVPGISSSYPDILPSYLVDGWRSKLREVFNEPWQSPYDEADIVKEDNPVRKLEMILASTRYVIDEIDRRLILLGGIIIPVQKKALHNELMTHLRRYSELQREKRAQVEENDLAGLEETVKALDHQKEVLDEFSRRYVVSES